MKAVLTARAALGLLATTLVISAASAGCGPGFEPYNRLNSPRVLAIKTAPSVAPAPGETTTLSAKTYTPNDIPLTYDWSWCPFAPGPGIPCPFTDDQVSQLAGVPLSLHLPTAADNTATFTHNIPPPLLQTLCEGMPGFPPPDCTDGFPIQVRLLVCTDSDPAKCSDSVDNSGTAVAAVRSLRLRFRDTDQPNANPTITGLQALIAGMDPPPDLTAMPSPTLVRKKATVINAVIDADLDAEMYMGKDDNDQPAQVYERLTLSWFVESGDTNHQRTSYIKGTTASGDATTQIKWTPAYKKDEKDSLRSNTDVAKIIVIIRDNREGVDWIEGNAALVEETTP